MTQPIEILSTPPAPRSGGCGCGGHDEAAPVLDVRAIPHAVRHGAVFGAFDAIPAGGSLVIIAPHLGSATEQTRRRMAEVSIDNLMAGLEGRPLTHRVG